MANRSTAERAAQARARLETEANVWISTASADGLPHLVPLSLAWLDEQIVVATPENTLTVRNIAATGRARAALDDADDVVIIDTDAEVVSFDSADPAVVERYVARVGWDPRNMDGVWSLLFLTPTRAHAWIGPAEIEGRTIIRDRSWLNA